MAAEIFIMPSRATSSAGDPYSGAKAYFYATGTTTLQPTYTTSGLGTPNANPVVADSGGQFPPIYLDASLVYRVVVKNSDDSVTLIDRDPINSISSTPTAATIVFSQPGANAETSDLEAHARQRVTVLDYIPKSLHAAIRAGTDPTNHTPYLQDMDTDGLDYLYFPAGGYNIDTAYVPTHDQHWEGEGKAATTINCGVNGYIVETTVSSRRISGEGIAFVGDTGLANSGGFKLFDPATYNWKDCSFTNFNREGLRFVQGVNVWVEHCDFNNCGRPSSATATISNAAPGVVTRASHGFVENTVVYFTTTGGLPTGLSINTPYYAVNVTTNTFELSLTNSGPSITTSSAGSGVHTCVGLPYAAVFGDPGATASVGINMIGGYVSSCGIGYFNSTARQCLLLGVTFESNNMGLHSLASEGDYSVNYWESNVIDGLLTESSGIALGNRVGTNFYMRYYGSAGSDRKIGNHRKGYLEAYRSTPVTPGGTTFQDLSFETVGDYYQVNCASAVVTVDRAGVYEARYRITFKADASARTVNMKLVADTGAGYVEVPGSNVAKSLAASETDTLTGFVRVDLTALGKIKLQYSVSNVAVTIDATGIGGTASTHQTCAHLDISHSGTE